MPAPGEGSFARIARRLGLEHHEPGTVVLMGVLVGVLLCAYTLAKVLRDALFIAEYGALALPYAYIGVGLASAGYVLLESVVARRLLRVDPTHFNQYVAILCSVLAALAYHPYRHWTIGAFYLWTGSQAMILLPQFWVLALDVWDSRRARRVFPLLTGCGLIGGLVGGGIAAWLTPVIQRLGLMWVLVALLLTAHMLTLAVERHRADRPRPADFESGASAWKIVQRSAYLKVFAAGLALSVVVSTLVDFQFKFFLQRVYTDPHALAQFLGKFYIGLNVLALAFQFGIAGFLLQRLGLGVSTALQPVAVLVFASWTAISAGWWVVVAMRWVQGVVFQTVGKSSVEIYYGAIRPSERRRIKPAIDTLVERWADAAVGVLLIVALRALHVSIATIAILTAGLALAWLALQMLLDHQYGRSFRMALSSRWTEPYEPTESMRTPASRRALVQALRGNDERRLVLALELSTHVRDPVVTRLVRRRLGHPSPAVRLAAIEAMDAAREPDVGGAIERALHDSNEAVRRAAVGYLLARRPPLPEFARRMLDGDDAALRRYVVEILAERPYEAPGAITLAWVEARIASAAAEDRLLAAMALSAVSGAPTVAALRGLLSDVDADVRRAALRSATRRPNRALLDDLLPLLVDGQPGHDARLAVAAIGDAAVPRLRDWLAADHDPREQAAAARTLATIASARALDALMPLVRGGDTRMRHLGLQALAQVRLRTRRPVLSRTMAHRLFLRELSEYRTLLEPTRALEQQTAPELRLLADSYRESAEMALERAVRALACWYDPRPLFGVFERLRARDLQQASPALEYLGHVLPGSVFRPVSRIFERETRDGAPRPAERPTADWLREAWAADDDWLRACAVRASRVVPEFDTRVFASAAVPALVQAEIDDLGNDVPDGPVRGSRRT